MIAFLEGIRDAALPVLTIAIVAFLGVIAKNIPAIMAALDAWIKLQVTVHQQTVVYRAVDTAVGILQTKLDQGKLQKSDITEDNILIQNVLGKSLQPVKESASAQNATELSLLPVVIGKLDTSKNQSNHERETLQWIVDNVDAAKAPQVIAKAKAALR